MLWLAIPVIGLIGKVIYDAVTDDDQSSSPRQKSTLELNLERLRNQVSSHSGYKIAIIGQPGAGKSSLVESLKKALIRKRWSVVGPLIMVGRWLLAVAR